MIKQQINNLKRVILENKGGFTSDLNGNLIKKNKGYFVGITHIKGKNLNNLIKKVLFIKELGFKHLKNLYIGGWYDDKAFYLDLSLFIKNKDFCLKVGNLFKQISVFDVKNLNCIELKNTPHNQGL